MGLIPDITCRHCGNTFKGIFNRCPNCGTRRVKQASRPTSTTAAAAQGSAAAAREGVNTRMHFIFGCVLVVAVIAAVIILINASLGGATGGGGKTVDIVGSISWNDAASPARPGSVTVNLLANGTQVDSKAVTAGEDGMWVYKFEKKARLDENKQEIKYTVSVSPIADYASTGSGYNLTLSYVEPVQQEPVPEATPVPVINSIVVSTAWGSELPDKQFAMNPGETVPLGAVTYPLDVQCTVSWRSTDESICTIDENGVVTGVAPGWGSIIASVGNVETEILVMVRDN